MTTPPPLLPLPLLSSLAVNSIDVLASAFLLFLANEHATASALLFDSFLHRLDIAAVPKTQSRHRSSPPSPSPPPSNPRCRFLLSLLQRRPPHLSLFISSFAVAPLTHRCRSKSRLPFADLPSLQCGSTPTSSSSFSDLGAILRHPFFIHSGKLDRPYFSFRLCLLSLSAAMASSSFASVASEPPPSPLSTPSPCLLTSSTFRLVLQHRCHCFSPSAVALPCHRRQHPRRR